MGPLGEIGALFNPGMRHEIEERRRKQSHREEAGNADPGKLGIDLLSGTAVINIGARAQDAEEPADADQPGDADEAPEPADASDHSHQNRSDQNRSDQPSNDLNGNDQNRSDQNEERVSEQTPPPAGTDQPDEQVQSGDADSPEATGKPQADTGAAPSVGNGVDASEHSDVDPAALEITRDASNDEPPA